MGKLQITTDPTDWSRNMADLRNPKPLNLDLSKIKLTEEEILEQLHYPAK